MFVVLIFCSGCSDRSRSRHTPYLHMGGRSSVLSFCWSHSQLGAGMLHDKVPHLIYANVKCQWLNFFCRCIYVLWKRRQKLKQDAGTVDQPLPMAPPPLTTPHEQNNNRIIISATNFAQELPELVPDTNRPSPSNTVHNPAYNLGQPEVQESNTGLLQREGPQDPMYDYPLVPQLAPDERNMQRLSNEGDMEQSGSYTYEN